MSNNVFGLAFCLNAVEMISLDSVGVGALLLGGLFLYDIFWVSCPLSTAAGFRGHTLPSQVFGTDVMVTVAKSFEAPIKCEYQL